jgi:DNA-binding response OmpR family regulator
LLVEALALEGGYHPIAAESGSRALHVIQSITVYLCLIDYLLPDGTGLALYDRLRAMEEFGATPALFLTAMRGEEEQALLARNVPVVEKPFELGTLLAAIEAQLLPSPAALSWPPAGAGDAERKSTAQASRCPEA